MSQSDPTTARMLFAALITIATLVAPSTARADGAYVLQSGGSSIAVENDNTGLNGRIGLGIRLHDLAYEAWGGVAFLHPEAADRCVGVDCIFEDRNEQNYTQIGFDTKYIRTPSSHVETYARVGAFYQFGSHGYLNERGVGVSGGVGFQIKGRVTALGFLIPLAFLSDIGPKVTLGVYAETTVDMYQQRGIDVLSLGAIWSTRLGFVWGSDF